MLFHTWNFLLFFVITYFVYLCLRRTRYHLHWLLICSYFFYGWWNPLYLLLIAYSTALDFFVVNRMENSSHKKRWLVASIVNNLLLLGFFKYGGFVTDNLNGFLSTVHAPFDIPAPGILLPVGISFYTFQSMSYTIDFYRGTITRERSFVRFAAFVALFPQLVAGPIERAANLLPQLHGRPKICSKDLADGASLFIVGLFKKIALADYLALYVDPIYAMPDHADGLSLALATFAFGWQIYFDFSGYTDMARGVARMLGLHLMINFNNPYLATGLGDFWHRWHISLSTWFRDYVYIPLGGNRRGPRAIYRNLLITMLLCGLWHGAAWTFVIWGALHAIGMIATRKLERSRFYIDRVPRFVKQWVVFGFVSFAWIFFRAENLGDAATIVTRICTAGWSDPRLPLLAAVICLAIWMYQFICESRARRMLEVAPVKIGLVVAMVLYIAIMGGAGSSPFIYFQF